MRTATIFTFCFLLITVGINAQDLPEIERKTRDNTYHFQEFEAMQLDALDPDKVSVTTPNAEIMAFESSPTMVAPMGNYKDFKIIKITLPSKPAITLDKKVQMPQPKQYLIKRAIKEEDK
ncbi:hypothetical protein [uncultured Cyclobacterium sp.]|uniref:hypothetical protein n=1 Tax=uncultured Cyclobacterium sp. TaxID=453820 RepID=UPI0030EE2B78|tara:strand:+ start:36465 stop:36824 length:360 start_codon:yes stop_codon:yes gene_type:complete